MAAIDKSIQFRKLDYIIKKYNNAFQSIIKAKSKDATPNTCPYCGYLYLKSICLALFVAFIFFIILISAQVWWSTQSKQMPTWKFLFLNKHSRHFFGHLRYIHLHIYRCCIGFILFLSNVPFWSHWKHQLHFFWCFQPELKGDIGKTWVINNI